MSNRTDQALAVGDIITSNTCGDYEIVNIAGFLEVYVLFLTTGYVKRVQAGHARSGMVKDPLSPAVYGVGYVGVGGYRTTRDKRSTGNGYTQWKSMISRCYCKMDKDYPRYGVSGVTVDPRWFNFQNYAKFYEDNYKEGYQLDKDLLVPGNKVYSPENCRFVPSALNSLLTCCHKARGKHPIGVDFERRSGKFRAHVRKGGVRKYLGLFDCEMDAHLAYKVAKELHVKEEAERYLEDGSIDLELYDALCRYKVVDDR